MIINQPKPAPIFANKTKLYLVPTIDTEFGEEWSHPKFSSAPSNLTDLPNINEWSESFIITIIEIWSGRRGVMQLANNCHRSVINKLIKQGKELDNSCRIRKIYLNQPIEGVIEATVTLRIKERVRSLILRFEGVDKRWVCTELNLL
ncbi:MAG: hypothetical protein JHC72_07865 [Candidatus Nanopelagicus sp.]|jgi:hypothetical protein|nr:hypothetical protein [Candidatus Nanopelagicus sp.]